MTGQSFGMHFLNSGNIFDLRNLLEELSIFESVSGLNVPGQIQTVFPDGINRSTRENQCDPG